MEKTRTGSELIAYEILPMHALRSGYRMVRQTRPAPPAFLHGHPSPPPPLSVPPFFLPPSVPPSLPPSALSPRRRFATLRRHRPLAALRRHRPLAALPQVRLRSPTGSRMQFGSLFVGIKKEMRTGGLNDALAGKKGARRVVRLASVLPHQLAPSVLQPLQPLPTHATCERDVSARRVRAALSDDLRAGRAGACRLPLHHPPRIRALHRADAHVGPRLG